MAERMEAQPYNAAFEHVSPESAASGHLLHESGPNTNAQPVNAEGPITDGESTENGTADAESASNRDASQQDILGTREPKMEIAASQGVDHVDTVAPHDCEADNANEETNALLQSDTRLWKTVLMRWGPLSGLLRLFASICPVLASLALYLRPTILQKTISKSSQPHTYRLSMQSYNRHYVWLLYKALP
jgi:hypothetical protein